MAKSNDTKNDINTTELANDVGIQVKTLPIRSEFQEIKNIDDVVVVNHDCSNNMNLGSDMKAVGLHCLIS